METREIVVLTVSCLVSVVLGYRLLRREGRFLAKLPYLLILLLPIVGPVIFLIAASDLPPHSQPRHRRSMKSKRKGLEYSMLWLAPLWTSSQANADGAARSPQGESCADPDGP